METICNHQEYRFLDCEECDTCQVIVCVSCGQDISENDFIEKGN